MIDYILHRRQIDVIELKQSNCQLIDCNNSIKTIGNVLRTDRTL